MGELLSEQFLLESDEQKFTSFDADAISVDSCPQYLAV